jgi:hypothetical protein
MTVSRKTLSQIFTLLRALNSNGVANKEDISWIRREVKDWGDSILRLLCII